MQFLLPMLMEQILYESYKEKIGKHKKIRQKQFTNKWKLVKVKFSNVNQDQDSLVFPENNLKV